MKVVERAGSDEREKSKMISLFLDELLMKFSPIAGTSGGLRSR